MKFLAMRLIHGKLGSNNALVVLHYSLLIQIVFPETDDGIPQEFDQAESLIELHLQRHHTRSPQYQVLKYQCRRFVIYQGWLIVLRLQIALVQFYTPLESQYVKHGQDCPGA